MGEWRLERAGPEDAKAAYDLLLESFFSQEPSTARLFGRHGPPSAERCIGVRALSQLTSVKAVSAAGEEMVGLAVNLNWESLPPPEVSHPPGEPYHSLEKFHEFVNERSRGEEPGWLTLHILTVHPGWRRRGIAEQLVIATEQLAITSGMRGCRIVCTSAHSAALVEKRGWEMVYSLPYSEYEDPVFHVDPPHLAVSVYLKSNPNYKEQASSKITEAQPLQSIFQV